MSTNSVLTPCKQGAVLSRYSLALAMTPFELSHSKCSVFLFLGWWCEGNPVILYRLGWKRALFAVRAGPSPLLHHSIPYCY